MADQKEINKKLDALMLMICSYEKQLITMRQEVVALAERSSQNSQIYSKTVDEHQSELMHIRSEVQQVQKDLKETKASRIVTKPISEIKINGLPKNLKTTSLDKVKKIFNALQIPNLINDVIDTREFVNKNNLTGSRSIIVSLKSDVVANFIVNRSRKQRGLLSSELFGGNSTDLIYVNELLPNETFKLFMKVRHEKKKGFLNSAWHEFGQIFVKKSENSKVVCINNMSDLEFI